MTVVFLDPPFSSCPVMSSKKEMLACRRLPWVGRGGGGVLEPAASVGQFLLAADLSLLSIHHR